MVDHRAPTEMVTAGTAQPSEGAPFEYSPAGTPGEGPVSKGINRDGTLKLEGDYEVLADYA